MDFIVLIVFGLAMYLLLFLPQQRKARDHKRLLESLAEGDEVVTNSGIYGFVNAVDDDVVWLDVAEGIELRMAKNAVASRIDVDAESEADDDE
jgi:preprotein translocase subunit YajC